MSEHPLYSCLDYQVIQIRGRDAPDLLNRILTLSAHTLTVGHGDWAFLLDHRGRVKRALILLRADVTCYYALTVDDASAFIEDLDLFVFSEDVTFNQLELTCVYWAGEGAASIKEDTGSQLTHYTLSLYGLTNERLSLIETTDLERVQELLNISRRHLSVAELDALRIERGAPSFNEYRGNLSPLDVSTRGISEGKGCYPGQEVIERTLAIGKPARVTRSGIIKGSPQALTELRIHLSQGDEIPLFIKSTHDGEAEEQKSVAGRVSSISSLSKEISDEMEFASIIAQFKRKLDGSAPLIVTLLNNSSEPMIEQR